MWKEFDTKLLDSFQKVLENKALEILTGFGVLIHYSIYILPVYIFFF